VTDLAIVVERLLPTPTKGDGEGGGIRSGLIWERTTMSTGQGGASRLRDVAGLLLPTPKTRDHKDGALGVDNRNRVDDTDSVPRAVRHLLEDGFLGDPLLPTPKASDGAHGGPGMRNSRGGIDALPAVAALLPTPQAHDAHGPKTPEQVERGRASGAGVRNLNETAVNELGLSPSAPSAAALLSTPTAGLGAGGGQRSHRFTGSGSQRTHNPT
jgi:hypothetical protein